MLNICAIKESKYLFNNPIIGKYQKLEKKFFSYHTYNTIIDNTPNESHQLIAYCSNVQQVFGPVIKDSLTILSKKDTGLPYIWEAIKINNNWIGVNTAIPNKLFKQMLDGGLIPGEIFKQEKLIKEFNYKADFSNDKYIIEVKHAHYVKNNIGYFPEKASERGARQLEAMMELKKQGKEIILIYILQNNMADKFTIAQDIDPIYYNKALEAKKLGIKSYAFNCIVDEKGIYINALMDFFI